MNYRQLPGSEQVYSGKEETQKDCMPLLLKTVSQHFTFYQVDNTYESSRDVTHRGVIVDIMNFSTTSKVKPISTFSRKNDHSVRFSTWFVKNKEHKSMLYARMHEL